MIGIYKITSPSNKIYIGQSINIEQRWKDYNNMVRCRRQTILYSSFQKYGVENHIFNVIEECNEDQLLEYETYWKEYYKVLDIPSLCCRMDGRGGKLSEETKNKMSKNKLGKATKYNYPIIEYDSLGNFKQIWENYIEIPNYKDVKQMCLKENLTRINGSLWRFKYDENFSKKLKLSLNYINKINRTTPIIQYDINKNIIREYKNNIEVINVFLKKINKSKSSSSIHACCKNKQKTAFGYVWKYKQR